MPRPLIVGIDPGTTAGLALLDSHGELLGVSSGKGLGLDGMVKRIAEHGLPLVIGTDKAKAPSLVAQAAVKTGARLFVPPEDLKEQEKRGLTSGFTLANAHERDALASALTAYSSIRSLLEKVERYAKTNPDAPLDRLLALVVRNEVSIQQAADALSEEDAAEDEEGPQDPTPQNVEKLRSELAMLRTDNTLLRSQTEKLRSALADATARAARLARRAAGDERRSRRRIDTLFSHKEERIGVMSKRIDRLEKALRAGQATILDVLSSSRGSLVVSAVTTLSDKEVGEGSLPPLLYVENVNVIGKKARDRLNASTTVLITPVKATTRTRAALTCTILDRADAPVVAGHALVRPESLERRRQDTGHFSSLIKAYQDERR